MCLMCGRFALTLPHDAMAQLFEARIAGDLMPAPRFNICPTQNITTVVERENGRALVPMRWGFLPRWYTSERGGPMLINARAETLAEKPAFREACRTRRCLIPASGFYEWKKDACERRRPFYIHAPNADFMAFAGIWQDWTSPEGGSANTCAIVTTSANDTMAPIHHRMPVLIAPENYALWLGEAGKGAAVLMRPASENALVFHPVSARINSSRPDDPDLIAPFDAIESEEK